MTYYEAKNRIDELKKILKESESEIAQLAVEHQIHVDIGEYGYGREVVIDSPQCGYQVGQWMPSSATC